METPAPFNLNQAIADWRDRLSRCPSIPSESLDELESHLRDAVHQLHSGGLPEAEAWSHAVQQLGREDLLDREFAKLAPPSRIARLATSWMITVLVGAIVGYAGLVLPNLSQPTTGWALGTYWQSALVISVVFGTAAFLLLLPALALSRKLNLQLSRVRALCLGLLVGAIVWLHPARNHNGMLFDPWMVAAGAIACGLGAMFQARFRFTPAIARRVAGAWNGMAGAWACALVWALVTVRQPWDALHRIDNIFVVLVAPILAALAMAWLAFPMGAVLGPWLQRRLQGRPRRASFGLGLLVGASVGLTLWTLRFVYYQLVLPGLPVPPDQLQLIREVTRRELAELAVIIPVAALWVGLWALRHTRPRPTATQCAVATG